VTRIYVCMEDAIAILEGTHPRWTLRLRFEEQAALRVPRTDKGKSRFTPEKAFPQCLAVDSHRPERVYCGTFGEGLWVSDDAGDTWHRSGKGIPESKMMAVAVSPLELSGGYGVVWVGTEPSRMFRSEDAGVTWAERSSLQDLPSKPLWYFPPRPYTHHVRWIQLDPHDANTLFVGIHEGGVMRSTDKGLSFEDHNPNAEFDPHGVAMHLLAPGRLYESAGGNDKTIRFQPGFRWKWPFFVPRVVITEGGYAETRDGGATWERKSDGLDDNHYLWEMAVATTDPETIIASASVGPIQAHRHPFAESYLIRRTEGQPWQRVSIGLPEANDSIVYDVVSNPHEPDVFYAANNKGVFRSADNGLTWIALDIPWPRWFLKQRQLDLVVVGD
jgi:hypothetical protein